VSQAAARSEVKLEYRLARLAQAESTGVLEVLQGKRRRRFWLRDGQLVATGSNLKKEQEEQVATGLPSASPELLALRVAALRMSGAMLAVGTKIQWTADDSPKSEEPAPMRRVLWEALDLSFSCERLLELIAEDFQGNPVCRTRGADSLKPLELPVEYREWLVGLDGYRTVTEVIQFGPGEPRSCAAALYQASIFGAVSYREVPLVAPTVRPTTGEMDDDEELVDEADDAKVGHADLASLIAASVTPLGGGEHQGGPSSLEIEDDDEDREWVDDDEEWLDSDEGAGDVEIAFDDDLEGPSGAAHEGADEGAGPTGPVLTEDWIIDREEASLRAEIHRILEAENIFEVLGLPHDSDFETFRGAYFRLARILHPDRVGDDKPELQANASQAFDRARAAWEIVKDDELRAETIDRVIHGKKSEEEEAYEQVQELLAIEKLFDRGLAQFRSGRIVQAHEIFGQVLTMAAKHPDFDVPEFRIYQGYCIWRMNFGRDDDEADNGVEMLQAAMNKSQQHQEGWILLARIVRERGHPDKAKRFVIRALKLNPENKDALREMERCRRELGEIDKKPEGFFARMMSKVRGGDKKTKKKAE
jgi:tetratricopeptide (TPR) repeat protein